MEVITAILDSLKSSAYDAMTNDELYDLVLGERYNVVFPNWGKPTRNIRELTKPRGMGSGFQT